MLDSFITYINRYYHGSDLNSYVGDIRYKLNKRLELFTEKEEDALLKSIREFESVFVYDSDRVLVYINSSNLHIPDQVLKNFRFDERKSCSWVSEAHGELRLKKLIDLPRKDLDYRNLLSLLVKNGHSTRRGLNLRIYFFNKSTGQVYCNSDAMLELGEINMKR